MGLTPASDKASKMDGEKEPTPAGLKKNSMPEKEPKSPGTKQNMMKPPKNGFMPGARGK